MFIRDYEDKDEIGWVRCRLISFLDCSYFDDIKKSKEVYANPHISLVAEDKGAIVAIMDVEYEKNEGDVCYFPGARGAVIWHLGVLPEYRNQGLATQMWLAVKERLAASGIKRVEVWTQDDVASNEWYQKQGFQLRMAYLNAFMRDLPKDVAIRQYINLDNLGNVLGIRSLNFEAPISRKAELQSICYRLHEVRIYELYMGD